MSKDTLATIAGMVVAICSTFQTMMPPDAPWWARATLAAVAAALGMWTGTVAYKPLPVGKVGRGTVASSLTTNNQQLTTASN